MNIGQFWFKNLGLGTTKPTSMLYTRLNQYKTYIWQNYNKQKYCQGCIINRGYTTVYVATLEQYQSNIFFIIPSSANVDVLDTYEGTINYFFVCEWFFEELCKFMSFNRYIDTTRSVGVNRYVDLVIYVWLEVGAYCPSVELREFTAGFRCIA